MLSIKQGIKVSSYPLSRMLKLPASVTMTFQRLQVTGCVGHVQVFARPVK